MEIWKDVKNYEGIYQISNFGQVRNNKKILKPTLKRGYLQIGLRKNGIRKFFQVHRLVADAFISNPNKLPQVNHIDENKLNNDVNNLEWCSVSYNNSYGTRLKRVVETNKSRQPVILYDKEGNFLDEFFSIMEASRKTKINPSCIVRSCTSKSIKPRKYIWRYKKEVIRCL